LHYLMECEYLTAAGRWFRRVITPEIAVSVKPATAKKGWRDWIEPGDVARVTPFGKAARSVQVGFARVVVVDLSGEEFQHALRRFRRRREERRGMQLGEDDFSAHGSRLKNTSA
jgi:hypothetical protein